MSNKGTELAPPPRHVSPSALGMVLFGGTSSAIGWALLAFSMFFVWGAVVERADLTSWYVLGDPQVAQGAVTSRKETLSGERIGTTGSSRPVLRYTYTYEDSQGETASGVSYSARIQLDVGESVTVEYVDGDPSVSRIQGMTRKEFGPILSLVLVFPLFAMCLVLPGLRKGQKNARLLRCGKVTNGTLVEERPTQTQIDGRVVKVLTFEFQAEDGQTYHAVARTHLVEALKNEDLERVLYDPSDPERSALWDDLPGSVGVGPRGGFVVEGWRWLAVLIAPCVVVFGHGGWFLYRHAGLS